MARAGVAAGAHGIMLEMHPQPEQALSDAGQALRPADLDALVPELLAIHEVMKGSEFGIVQGSSR
jgi:3-deoxy-D-arabino-heptulosonate 7-phosphate (DAHP) synthase